MDKLKMETKNKADENFKKLAELFPNAVTETIVDGEVVRAIDKDVLMQEISTKVVEGKEERYQFTWPDKKKAILEANSPINKTLRPYREESVDFDNTENLYIEGNNLEVLKLLQETYLGKIKMIYIDPPYNTGNDFIYKDNFSMDSEEWKEKSGDYDEEGNRLVKNLDGNGRFHTDWLNMMYPRLKLAKDLLSDDGVIFISIDDNEQENLKKICDEIFGNSNFINNIVVETGEVFGTKASHANKTLIKVKDYILAYRKSNVDSYRNILYDKMSELYDLHYNTIVDGTSLERISLKEYLSNIDWVIKIFKNLNCDFTAKGINIVLKNSETFKEFFYKDVANKLYTDQPLSKKISDTMFENMEIGKLYKYDNKYVFRTSGNTIRFLQSFDKCLHISDDYDSQYVRSSIRGDLWKSFHIDMRNIDDEGNMKFKSGKKPVRLIKQIIKWTNFPKGIVLDFFSGSATTAHAVMQLNAEDGGNRKFIMVQVDEKTDEKSEAYKAGYKNICGIGKERIRRAGAKIKEEREKRVESEVRSEELKNDEQIAIEELSVKAEELKNVEETNNNSTLNTPNSTLDIGFRVLKLDSSNMKDVYYTPESTNIDMFDTLVDNIKEDRTAEDLLFQVMLELGILLSSKIEREVLRVERKSVESGEWSEELKFAGKEEFSEESNDCRKDNVLEYTCYNVSDGYLIACFDDNVTEDVITEIAKRKPYYFVMKDSSMANDSVAANFEQIFETYSPDTVRKVL